MIVTGNKRQITFESHIKIMDHKSESVHGFENLGLLVNGKNYMNEEIIRWIKKNSIKCYCG
jgi:hypothetical protein